MPKPSCYTCFDGDSDMHYYTLMQAWHANDNFDFTFDNVHDLEQVRDTSTEETIKRSLRRRLNEADVFIVLIGNSTRYLYKFVRWEIEVAIELGLPIIAVNLNGSRRKDDILCPPILRDKLVAHVAYGSKIVGHAIKHWPSWHNVYKLRGDSRAYHYVDEIYEGLGY